MRSQGLTLLIREVPKVLAARSLSKFVISPYLIRGITVHETPTLIGVQNPEEANLKLRRAMDVMCCVLERNVASVVVFIVESVD